MPKLRSVNTRFWEDPFIEDLDPYEKLLFLYFLTNPLTNMLGVYEVTIKRMSNDTGLTIERVQKALKGFNDKNKVYYIDSYVILPGFLKNQNLNTNMKLGAERIFENLPKSLKNNISGNPLKGFESIRNAMLNMNRNKNRNIEVEGESKLPPKTTGTLMKNSGVIIQDVETAFLKTDDLKNADAKYYFNQVLDWSSNGGKLGKDWIAGIRKWARGDLAEGKLSLKPPTPPPLGSTEFRP